MADVEAAIFDLDGTVMLTLDLQQAVWRDVFNEYLRGSQRAMDTPDYRAFVDGRARVDGVRTFLASRGLGLPDGGVSDPPGAATVYGLANRKTQLFRERLDHHAIRADPDAVRLVCELRRAGVRVGLASASEDTETLVERAGIGDLFDVRMDEAASQRYQLRGKPAPDVILKCLDLLGVKDSRRAVVFDDATVGMEAGRAARFGLVVGIDRGGNATALREHGADWVVSSLAEVSVQRLLEEFASRT